MTEQQQRICIWTGIGFAPLFFIGFGLFAGFIPPPAPEMSAGAVARLFSEHGFRIRIGIWIACAAAPLLAFFVAALTHQIRRIAGSESPLATAQSIVGSCLILEFLFPQLVWQTAAYRSERSPEMIQMLNDLAWLPYIGIVGTAMAQMAIIAVVVFQDARRHPLLPRWCAYLNIWTALGVVSGSCVVFFHSGLLAWNGILSWWVLCVSFFIWMVTMTCLMLRASRIAEATEPASLAAGLQPTAG
jgi:hypothetical protein